jgi:aminoethylphosphonate catabolism LysR family transcriptional regulator
MLFVSQPTVTIQLRQLESAYGVELVHRVRRGIELSSIGRDLFALTERIFALEQQAVDLLTNASGLLMGDLRVGGVAPHFVMRLLAAFSSRYPHIQLSLTLGNSTETLRDLREYRTDVAVIGEAGDRPPPDDRLSSVLFSRANVVMFVHRSHKWAGREGVSLAELSGEPLIMRQPGSVSRRALEEALEAAGTEVNIALEVSREGVSEAVAAGLGVGMTTDVEFPPDERVHLLRILDADVESRAYVVSLRDRHKAPVIRAFMELAGELGGDQGDDGA